MYYIVRLVLFCQWPSYIVCTVSLVVVPRFCAQNKGLLLSLCLTSDILSALANAFDCNHSLGWRQLVTSLTSIPRRSKKASSSAGSRTPLSRVTGGCTSRYTTQDMFIALRNVDILVCILRIRIVIRRAFILRGIKRGSGLDSFGRASIKR